MGKVCSCDAKEETIPNQIEEGNRKLSEYQIQSIKRVQGWFRGYKVRRVIEDYFISNSLKLSDVLLDAKSFDDYISQFIYRKDVPEFCSRSFCEFPRKILDWYRYIFGNLIAKPKSTINESDFILHKSSQLINRFQGHILEHISRCFELSDQVTSIISGIKQPINFKEYSDVELDIPNLNANGEVLKKPKIVLLFINEFLVKDHQIMKILNINDSVLVYKGFKLEPQLKYEIINIGTIAASSGNPKKLIEFVKIEECSRVFYGQLNRMNKSKHGLGLLAKIPIENSFSIDEHSMHDSFEDLFFQRKKTVINLVETTPIFHPKTPKKASRKNITSKLSITPKSNLELLMSNRVSPMKLNSPSDYSGIDSEIENSKFLKQIKENTKIVKEGIYKYPSNLYFGLFDNDNYCGFGFYLDGQNSSYYGEFRNNKFNGYGIYKTNEIDYRGLFCNGKFHGFGELKGQNSRKFMGCFWNGKKQNLGYEIFEDKSYYVGWYKNNKAEGLGYMEWKSGYRYFGFWNDGKMEGYGKYYMKNGDIFCGGFLNNVKHGPGQYIYHNTGCTLSGNWVEGSKRGVFQLVDVKGQSKTIKYFDNVQVG